MYKIIQDEGLGTDVVSGGELYTAIKSGFDTSKIYLSDYKLTTLVKNLKLDFDEKDVRKNDEETDYQIIAKKTDMITSKRNKRSSIDNEFVVKLSKIADTKGIKKEVLVEELYDYDLDFLKNNFIAFGEDFIREGKENFIKKNSLDSLMNIIDIMP